MGVTGSGEVFAFSEMAGLGGSFGRDSFRGEVFGEEMFGGEVLGGKVLEVGPSGTVSGASAIWSLDGAWFLFFL